MKDVQSQPDFRNIPIDKVGIKNLRYPITVRDRRDGFQHTIALINMFVDLPHNNKGTHMSRFVELLHLLRPDVSLQKFSVILEKMKQHLKAASAPAACSSLANALKTGLVVSAKAETPSNCNMRLLLLSIMISPSGSRYDSSSNRA